MTPKSYPIYKGLQKPLTYKGFKGKYIYWALASLIFGLIIGAIASALTNIFFAGLCSLLSIGSSISFILHKQKKGNHSRKNHHGISVPQTKLLISYGKSNQEPI